MLETIYTGKSSTLLEPVLIPESHNIALSELFQDSFLNKDTGLTDSSQGQLLIYRFNLSYLGNLGFPLAL